MHTYLINNATKGNIEKRKVHWLVLIAQIMKFFINIDDETKHLRMKITERKLLLEKFATATL
jgi:hypothetical protein